MNELYDGEKIQTFKSLPNGSRFGWLVCIMREPYISKGWTKLGDREQIADEWETSVGMEEFELEYPVVLL